jgi:lipopolysaccharide transport system permease protein
VFKSLGNILIYRELLFNITLRQIKVKYKQTVLGILWAVLKPLSLMAIFTIIFSKFAKIPSDGIPYPIFAYSALLPWTFFSTSLSFAIPSLQDNKDLITKVYFPREIFPISSLLAAFVDFCIAAVIFVVLMFLFKVSLSLNAFFIFPILLIQIIFTLGISLFFSALNVFYRDIGYALPLFTQLLMYACPIIYPISIVPVRIKPFYMLNPMAPIIDGYRRVLIQAKLPDFYYLGIAAFVSILIFYFSYIYFKKVKNTFADII